MDMAARLCGPDRSCITAVSTAKWLIPLCDPACCYAMLQCYSWENGLAKSCNADDCMSDGHTQKEAPECKDKLPRIEGTYRCQHALRAGQQQAQTFQLVCQDTPWRRRTQATKEWANGRQAAPSPNGVAWQKPKRLVSEVGFPEQHISQRCLPTHLLWDPHRGLAVGKRRSIVSGPSCDSVRAEGLPPMD